MNSRILKPLVGRSLLSLRRGVLSTPRPRKDKHFMENFDDLAAFTFFTRVYSRVPKPYDRTALPPVQEDISFYFGQKDYQWYFYPVMWGLGLVALCPIGYTFQHYVMHMENEIYYPE